MGTEGDRAVDIAKLREITGHITIDEGYVNTGSCRSAITFVDGEKGVLRYRGIPIEELALKSTFVETCWLLIYGELPTAGAAQGLEQPVHQLRDDPRGALPPLRRLPVHWAPHGHPLGHDQRHELLRARSNGDGGRRPHSRSRPPASSASCAPSPRPPTRRPSASRSSTPSPTSTTARTSCT